MLVVLLAITAAVWGAVVVLRRRRRFTSSKHPSLGFLHPAAGGGGGGERVLWIALCAVMDADLTAGVDRRYVLYSGRYPKPGGTAGDAGHLVDLAEEQFGVRVDRRRLQVAFLDRTPRWVDPQLYPRVTMLRQLLWGGIAAFLDVTALGRPDVMVDTTGIPGAYPFLRLLGCTVATYTHYPVVSEDMCRRVAGGVATYNNNAGLARSRALTAAKLWYYAAVALLYRGMGGCAAVVMTNSSWTDGHIRAVWRTAASAIVFPPVNLAELGAAPLDPATRRDVILSVGQFRPEKDHALQLRAFAAARTRLPPATRLVLLGGARHAADRARVEDLRALAASLGVADSVDFVVNAPFPEVRRQLTTAAVGLHTMRDEHFGIVVVEYMAAGAIAVAHDSAGPKADIVRPGVDGYLCATVEGYAAAIVDAVELRHADEAKWRTVTAAARGSAARFSDASFSRSFVERLAPLLR